MKIAIGSTNLVKVQAVQEVLEQYPHFAAADFTALSVQSDVAEQPLSMEETIRGAKNRAKNAFEACSDCQFSFGIESGLVHAVGAQTGFLNISVCSIYNGLVYHIGFSTGFEIPPPILRLIFEMKMDLSQACYHYGITANSNIGSAEGLIGILTNGRINRKEYTKQCIHAAFVQLENTHLYHSQ